MLDNNTFQNGPSKRVDFMYNIPLSLVKHMNSTDDDSNPNLDNLHESKEEGQPNDNKGSTDILSANNPNLKRDNSNYPKKPSLVEMYPFLKNAPTQGG